MDLKNLHLETLSLPANYKEIIANKQSISPELAALGFKACMQGDNRYNCFQQTIADCILRVTEEDENTDTISDILQYQLRLDAEHAMFKPAKQQKYIKEQKTGKQFKTYSQKLGAWLTKEIEKQSGVELYDDLYIITPDNRSYIVFQITEEAVYRQLLIDVSAALHKLDSITADVKDSTATANIPAYKGHANANMEHNQFVVSIKNPDSIAAALKYQIDNADEFLARFDEIVSEGYEGVSYGVIEEDEFENLYLLDGSNGDYDEEVIANELAKHPRLYPLVAEYIKQVVLPASEAEKTSGPWATEETILGQFIVPMLAEKDKQYYPLLVQLVKTNVEIRCSPRFQNWFAYVEVPVEE